MVQDFGNPFRPSNTVPVAAAGEMPHMMKVSSTAASIDEEINGSIKLVENLLYRLFGYGPQDKTSAGSSLSDGQIVLPQTEQNAALLSSALARARYLQSIVLELDTRL